MATLTQNIHTEPGESPHVRIRDFGSIVVVDIAYGNIETKFFLPDRDALATLLITLGSTEVEDKTNA